jgi:hypothetical protein
MAAGETGESLRRLFRAPPRAYPTLGLNSAMVAPVGSWITQNRPVFGMSDGGDLKPKMASEKPLLV